MSEQWRMAADDEYAVVPVSDSYRTSQLLICDFRTSLYLVEGF